MIAHFGTLNLTVALFRKSAPVHACGVATRPLAIHSPYFPRPVPRAFTLIEALALVALVAIVIPPVMYAISRSTSAASLAAQREAAGRVASEQMAEQLV